MVTLSKVWSNIDPMKHGLKKGCPTWNPDCIEQSKMFKIEVVTSKYHGSVPVPHSRLFPWKLVEKDQVKAYFIYYGASRNVENLDRMVSESFEVEKEEYERVTKIFHEFEKRPDWFEIEDWTLPKKENFRRCDELRKFQPLPQPSVLVENDGNKVSISFKDLYPCDVLLGSDEPVLTKEIIRYANKNGFWVSAKAVHHVIRSWMNDLKSGDADPIYKIWICAPCGHNYLSVTIERDPDIKKRNRYAV